MHTSHKSAHTDTQIISPKETHLRKKSFSPANPSTNPLWSCEVMEAVKSTPCSLRTLFPRNEHAQAQYALSFIKDPLWKRVCGDMLHLMGPAAIQMFQLELGVPQDKTMTLYCKTEELLPFLQTYHFVILAALQKYFSWLHTLKIICKTQKKKT